ncbi:MAG TPA: hypothetical protein VIQ77_01670 [Mucilaginibacter sp.]|jgi:hypothetical protein
MKEKEEQQDDKDTLSQADLENGLKTFEKSDKPHAALETPDGKNNGAEPAVYQSERKSRT